MPPPPLRLLFVADGRSPIALNWIAHFVAAGCEVHLASTFPCRPGLDYASFQVVPVAFSQLKAERAPLPRPPAPGPLAPQPPTPRPSPGLKRAAVGLRTTLRQWLGPLTLPAAAGELVGLIARLQPDLIHAMRIPYEGMLAALAVQRLGRGVRRPPLLVSIWGNDFTLHAPSTPWMAGLTRRALQAASGLHADCARDVRLAWAWGLPAGARPVVLPGAGGVQPEIFYPPPDEAQPLADDALPDGAPPAPIIVQPRGVRAYVRNDVFFRAVPLVLQRFPQARFVCPNMAAEPLAQRWVADLRLEGPVELLPAIPRPAMATLFRRAQAAVSPSVHDGTPNTLLEAMACGCLPVAGDLESLREWIVPGVNGLLFDPTSPEALAEAVCLALAQPGLRGRARRENRLLIERRASYPRVMAAAEEFYRALTSR